MVKFQRLLGDVKIKMRGVESERSDSCKKKLRVCGIELRCKVEVVVVNGET